MDGLEIPERAYEAGESACSRLNPQIASLRLQLDTAVEAAAPIIVATELRSFVMALRQMVPLAHGATVDPPFIIYTIAGGLKRRADELDPEGNTT